MRGGGLTWAGWLMVGVGGMLVYAGMTGQSLVTELAGVLNGRSPKSTAPTPLGPVGGVTNPADHPSTPGGDIPPVTRPVATVPPASPRISYPDSRSWDLP